MEFELDRARPDRPVDGSTEPLGVPGQLDVALADVTEGRSQGLAVALVDLDRFKVINDDAGHQAGDALLRDIAERFGGHVADSALIARLGGDEWLVLFRDIAEHRPRASTPPVRCSIACSLRSWSVVGRSC